MNLSTLKTRIKSYLPVKDLIKINQPDSIYYEIFRTSTLQMHKSLLLGKLQPNIVFWIDQLAFDTQVVIKKSNLDWTHGYFLYSQVFNYSLNAKYKEINIFESGTARGFSSIIMVKAVLDAKKIPSVVTFDLIDNRARYWNIVGDESGRRTRSELLNKYDMYCSYINYFTFRSKNLKSQKFKQSYFNLAFLDGAHTYKDVKREFNYIMNKLVEGGMVIFDDAQASKYPGVVKFIETLNTQNVSIYSDGVRFKKFAVFLNR